MRTTEAYHNVAGFEFENTYRAEFVDNIAHDNVGGFLVFDLPGRGQYGEKNQVHHNKTYDNNLKSFAPRGAIVGYVPAGIGMLVLASDQLEIYNNEIYNNDTAGLAIVNFGLVSTREGDRKYDYYPEAMHVAANTFRDNGGNPQLPNNERNGCTGDPRLPAGVPGQSDFPSTNDLNSVPPPPLDCMTDNATLLPAILVVKNSGKSAHIVWDGGVDPGTDGFCTEYPKDGGGVALNLPNPDDFERYESRADERGRPNYYIFDPDPACASDPDGQHHAYNAWKFDEAGALKPKVHGLCIEMDGAGANTFEGTLPNTMLVDPFLNAHFSTADPTAEMNQQPAENTVPDPATNCPTLTAPLLQQTFPVLGTFTANPANDPAPTEAEIAAACDAVIQGEVNYNALNKYNCPRLNQYGLFQNKADPRSAPNGFGVPFNLNTALFSDYAVKYRVLYLPPQAANPAVPQKAGYADRSNCKTLSIFNCNTATLEFPTGTVFAKTFAFRNGANEDVVETRLLIKRPAPDGSVNWTGMAYLWEDNCAETGGTRCARLKIEGARKDVSWDYEDEDAAARNLDGSHPHYTGSTRYGIPSAGACLICHSADDKEAGAAPIGPKVRNLNKNYDYGGAIGVRNQLTRWSELGLITLPDTVEAPLPKWNVPGSGVPAAANPSPSAVDVSKDKHMRARSFLEVNCMHCHNSAGYAQNSGLGLDANDALLGGLMGQGHGICKTPIAAGKAAENVYYDIVPADSAGSLLFTRLSSATAGIMMPPMARSVTQAEAMNLVGDWINTSVSDFAHPDANTCSQGSGTLPVLMGLPSP